MDLRNRCTAISSNNMQLPRLPTINLISKPAINNTCFQENRALPRFYHQPSLYLDSNIPYHVTDQQNNGITPELSSFSPYSSEMHRHFTAYHHPQYPSRIDTQSSPSSNGMQIPLLPPPPVHMMAPEENSNGLRCISHITHPSASFPLPCQNNSLGIFNSNRISIDNGALPHSMCNLGIINLHREHPDLQQIAEDLTPVHSSHNLAKQSEELLFNDENIISSKNSEIAEKIVNDDSQKIKNKLTSDKGHDEIIQDNNSANRDINSNFEDSNESDEIAIVKSSRAVFCKICRKGYGSQESLETHMLSHGPHKCPICNKIFLRQCNLKMHMIVHAERSYPCTDCGKKFKSQNALQAHANTVHTNSDLSSVICESCGIVLKNRKSLLQHEQIHTRGKRFACDLCDERFNRKDALNRHVVRIHVEEKFFTCQICNTHFNTNEGLQEHLWTHETERPYQCQLCQRRFPQRSALERHIKIHSGQRPFSCGVCGLSFTRSYRLKAHLQTHIGT